MGPDDPTRFGWILMFPSGSRCVQIGSMDSDGSQWILKIPIDPMNLMYPHESLILMAPCDEFTGIHQDLLRSIRIYWNPLRSIWIHNVPSSFSQSRSIETHSLEPSGSIRIHWDPSGSIEPIWTHWDSLGYIRIHPNLVGFIRTYIDPSGPIKIH